VLKISGLPKRAIASHLSVLGVVTADVSGEIWELLFRVTKGMKSRIVFDAKVGGISRGMVETNDRLELKYLAGGIEIDESYAVSEGIMYPPDIDWFGRHFKLAVQQTLVKAVARPKHQLMWSKPHRLPIPVCCRVVYGENSHQLCPISKITLCSDFIARERCKGVQGCARFPRSLYAQTLSHANDAKACKGKFASGRMSELVDNDVVFRGFASCDDSDGSRVAQYFIVPRPKGGFVMFSVQSNMKTRKSRT
jgi:hypothetical protein